MFEFCKYAANIRSDSVQIAEAIRIRIGCVELVFVHVTYGMNTQALSSKFSFIFLFTFVCVCVYRCSKTKQIKMHKEILILSMEYF